MPLPQDRARIRRRLRLAQLLAGVLPGSQCRGIARRPQPGMNLQGSCPRRPGWLTAGDRPVPAPPVSTGGVVRDGRDRVRPGGRLGVRGSYFEGFNCEAICPCRSVSGRPGGSSSAGECFGVAMTASKGVTAIGALSWSIDHGHADGIDLSGLRTVLSIRYLDQVQPSTPWKVVLYVDAGADVEQRAALADIFLGRAGGTVARLYGPAIGEVCAVRPAASPWSTSRPASASTSSDICT